MCNKVELSTYILYNHGLSWFPFLGYVGMNLPQNVEMMLKSSKDYRLPTAFELSVMRIDEKGEYVDLYPPDEAMISLARKLGKDGTWQRKFFEMFHRLSFMFPTKHELDLFRQTKDDEETKEAFMKMSIWDCMAIREKLKNEWMMDKKVNGPLYSKEISRILTSFLQN